MAKSFHEAVDTPVVYEADVVVAGGGSAGIGAAIAAARMGAKTIVLERNFCLGGMMTAGLMTDIGISPLAKGLAREIVNRLADIGAAATAGYPFGSMKTAHGYAMIPLDAERTKGLLDEMLSKENVRIMLGSPVVAAIKKGRTLEAVITENKSGRQAVTGKVFIDSTGDGDLAARAGAAFEVGRPEDGLCSSATLMFRVCNIELEAFVSFLEANPQYLNRSESEGSLEINDDSLRQLRQALIGTPAKYAGFSLSRKFIDRILAENSFSEWELKVINQRPFHFFNQPEPRNQLLFNATRFTHISGAREQELSDAMIEGRRQARFIHEFMRRFVPGFASSDVFDTAAQLGVRESRHVIGEYMLTDRDVHDQARFDDAIALNDVGLEVHNPTGGGYVFSRLKPEEGEHYEIPYRCILVRDLDNCLTAGRCFSATHLALSAARCIGLCMSMGQAAGTAAALACAGGTTLRQVQIGNLQKLIQMRG